MTRLTILIILVVLVAIVDSKIVVRLLAPQTRVFSTDDQRLAPRLSKYACTSLDGPTCDFVNGAKSPAVDTSGITDALADLVHKLAKSLKKGLTKTAIGVTDAPSGVTGVSSSSLFDNGDVAATGASSSSGASISMTMTQQAAADNSDEAATDDFDLASVMTSETHEYLAQQFDDMVAANPDLQAIVDRFASTSINGDAINGLSVQIADEDDDTLALDDITYNIIDVDDDNDGDASDDTNDGAHWQSIIKSLMSNMDGLTDSTTIIYNNDDTDSSADDDDDTTDGNDGTNGGDDDDSTGFALTTSQLEAIMQAAGMGGMNAAAAAAAGGGNGVAQVHAFQLDGNGNARAIPINQLQSQSASRKAAKSSSSSGASPAAASPTTANSVSSASDGNNGGVAAVTSSSVANDEQNKDRQQRTSSSPAAA